MHVATPSTTQVSALQTDYTTRECPALAAPANGALSPPGASAYQDEVTFSCNQGFEMDGAVSATCQANGTWTETPFVAVGVVVGVGCLVAGLMLTRLVLRCRAARNGRNDIASWPLLAAETSGVPESAKAPGCIASTSVRHRTNCALT
ncbi:Hypp4020 [Branchiostoma lanceolatum]|uniref:Hypp4020 protein n=1 Tax=Branchiostoma lanceolatum TaxID=7740 RepID=A0A8K0EWE0_BRALA|nr:Hypp4020 [Branchiostoma lanceolatum]